MRIRTALLPAAFLQIGAVLCQAAASPSSSADIFYWPVAAPQPSLLAKIEYNSHTLDTHVLSYTPPPPPPPAQDPADGSSSDKDARDLVRVGFFVEGEGPGNNDNKNKKLWAGSVISQTALTTQRQKLHLYLGGPSETPYHVSLSPHYNQSGDALEADLVFSQPGPRPELNKPVVINPDGTTPEAPEKTLFQKYWWVFLIVTFLAMSGGGGEQGQQR